MPWGIGALCSSIWSIFGRFEWCSAFEGKDATSESQELAPEALRGLWKRERHKIPAQVIRVFDEQIIDGVLFVDAGAESNVAERMDLDGDEFQASPA